MADRYWVGGTANWDSSTTANWSATKGGAGGSSVPTSADNVFITNAPATYWAASTAYALNAYRCPTVPNGYIYQATVAGTSGSTEPTWPTTVGNTVVDGGVTWTCANATVTVSVSSNSLDFTCTGFIGTLSFNASINLSCYGSLTLAAGMTISQPATSTLNMSATSTGKTITTAGKSIPGNMTFNGTGGGWTLQDALTVVYNFSVSAGTFDTGNYNIDVGYFYSAGTTTRTINLGSSTITISGAGGVNTITGSGLTFNAGTSTFNFTNGQSSFSASQIGVTYYNVIFGSAAQGLNAWTIYGNNTFNNLTFAGVDAVGCSRIQFAANQTINGTLTAAGGAGNKRLHFKSYIPGTQVVLTINSTPSLSDVDFQDVIVNGTAAPISGTRIGNQTNCSGISFDTPKTVYWNLTGSQLWTANAWCTSSDGGSTFSSPSTNNFPLPQDTAKFTNSGAMTSITMSSNSTAPMFYGNIDFSSRTSAVSISFSLYDIAIVGNFTLSSAVTISNTNYGINFQARNTTQTLISAGKTFGNITIDNLNGTVQLGDAGSINSNYNLYFYSGNFDTKGYALTTGTLTELNSYSPKSVKLNNSTVTLSSISAVISIQLYNNGQMIFDAGTSTINITSAPTTTRITSGGCTFYNINYNTSTSGNILLFQDSITCNNLTIAAPSSAGFIEVLFYYGVTSYINGTLTCTSSGSAIRRHVLRSNGLFGLATVVCNAISTLSDVDFRDIVISGNAVSGGNISGTRLGDLGGTTGINFSTPKTVYWNLTGSQYWSSTGWCTSSDGGTTFSSPSVNNFPLAQDTAILNNNGAATTITLDNNWHIGSIDFSSRTTVVTLAWNTTGYVYGNFKLGTGVTCTNLASGEIDFYGSSTQTIQSSGVTIPVYIIINSRSSTVQLADALNNGTKTVYLYAGTFDAVTYNVSIGTFYTSSGSRTLKMGSGTWTLSGTGSILWYVSSSGLIFYKGTANILLSDTSTTSRTITTGGFAYNKLTIGGATGISTTTISGGGLFTELASTKTVAHTIAFASGSTTYISKWSATGTSGNILTIAPGTAASIYTLYITNPQVSALDYISATYCVISTNSPAEFYIGANGTVGTGCTGAIIASALPTPRTLYWVAGTGNWNDTAHWSTTSGTGSGQAIPTSFDTVIFDSGSNATAYTVTFNSTPCRCAALTMGAPASGAVTWAGSGALSLNGSFNLSGGTAGITRTWTGYFIIGGANGGSYTFNTNGISLTNSFAIYGVGATWTLASAITTTSSLTVYSGTFATGNYNVTSLGFGASSSSILGYPDIIFTLGSSTITSTGNVIDFSNASNLTLNANTSTISATYTSGNINFYGGNSVFYNVSFASSTTPTITGINTFNNLTITKTSNGRSSISFSANQTINGTLTCSGNNAVQRVLLASSAGTILTVNTFATASDIDFRDITIAGNAVSGGNISGTRLGDLGGNANITFNAAKTVYWNLAGTNNWSATGWANTSGGTPNIINFPLAQDTAIVDNSSSGTQITIESSFPYSIGTIDFSNRTSAFTLDFTFSSYSEIYGDFKLGSGITVTGTYPLQFYGRSKTQYILSAGKTLPIYINLYNKGGTVQLSDSLTLTNTNGIAQFYGTFDASTYNVTTPAFSSTASSNIRTLKMGSGTWTLTGAGTIWNAYITNLTFDKGTANILLSNTSTTSRSFSTGGSGMSFNKITIGGATGSSTTTFNTSYNYTLIATELASTKTVAHTISFTGMDLLKFGNFTVSGSPGAQVTINGVTGSGAPTYLVTTSTIPVYGIDYLTLSGISAYGLRANTYSYNNNWYVGNNSLMSNAASVNTTGFINYSAYVPPAGGSFLGFFDRFA